MAEAAVDNISSLPDAILSQILSRIPTKEAVATSILSKRWTHLWKIIDNIDFSFVYLCDDIESYYSFHEFVNSVLLSRDAAGSHFINSFTLGIQYENPDLSNRFVNHINKWISFAVQRGLKYLHLDVVEFRDDYERLKLPHSILTCRTLVSLYLDGFHVKDFDFSSIGFGFPSLNALHLNDMIFHNLRDFMLLLAGCPNLEHLQVVDIRFGCEEEDYLTIQEFKSLSLPKLTSADITEWESAWSSSFPLNALSNSKYLCTDHKVYKAIHPYVDIPFFHNLTRLKLYNSWDLVVQVLQHCPNLQNLGLYQELYSPRVSGYGEFDEKDWVEPELVPDCFSSYLRTCTMDQFPDLQSELMLAKYILKNARMLQIMKIKKGHGVEHLEIERKLSTFPKASATCELFILFVDISFPILLFVPLASTWLVDL